MQFSQQYANRLGSIKYTEDFCLWTFACTYKKLLIDNSNNETKYVRLWSTKVGNLTSEILHCKILIGGIRGMLQNRSFWFTIKLGFAVINWVIVKTFCCCLSPNLALIMFNSGIKLFGFQQQQNFQWTTITHAKIGYFWPWFCWSGWTSVGVLVTRGRKDCFLHSMKVINTTPWTFTLYPFPQITKFEKSACISANYDVTYSKNFLVSKFAKKRPTK